MKVIGLTGGIGAGKSTVAGYLKELGAAVVDLDKVGHEVLLSGGPAFRNVVREFGQRILDKKGEIDRGKLGKIVFSNEKDLLRLNRIIHPEIDLVIVKQIEEFRKQGVKVVVLEAAVMQEAGKIDQVDELWVITAPETLVPDRLSRRSRYSREEVRARINSQLSDVERIKGADVVINNRGTAEELKQKVQVEWQKLMDRVGEHGH
jgi:dephospho-CoA kinase